MPPRMRLGRLDPARHRGTPDFQSTTMAVSSSATVKSERLNGTFVGELVNNGRIKRWRNIKYGSYARRFTRAQLVSDYKNKVVDCIKQGPLCPQETPYVDTLIGVPSEQVKHFELNYDEFECLNLMIVAPCVSSTEPLPVVVWIHGGGNTAGTPYRGVNDPSDLIARGAETGRPVIFVCLSFRVHLFGWLPWDGQGNWSLHDQQLGLEWVHSYISEFGGDPTRITLAGQSAGSCDAYMHSAHPGATKLFRQAAFFSGTHKSLSPRSLEDYSRLSDKVAETAGLPVSELRDCPWQQLVEATTKLGVQVLFPLDDGSFLPPGKYGTAPTSLDAVIVSDAREDAYFWFDYMSDKDVLAFASLPSVANLLGECRIQPSTDPKQLRRQLGDLLTSAIFHADDESVDQQGRASGVKVYRQLFDATNPFSPELGNNHMVELLYGLNAYHVPSHLGHIVRETQDRWLRFFVHEAPCNPDSALLVDDAGVREISVSDVSQHRRLDLLPVLSKHIEPLRQTLKLDGWP